MQFVVAPDAFKGCLSAERVGRIVEHALQLEMPEALVDVVPMADGGEGTVDALLSGAGGARIEVEVTGPTGTRQRAFYGVLGDGETAVIEVAAIAGFTNVPEGQRNPLHLTTYGIGECMLHALEEGCRRLVIGLGGSATNDGGLGMLQALGVTFCDGSGKDVTPFAAALPDVQTVDYATLDSRIKNIEIRVACDVDNPLCGPRGATHVFGPQKGVAAARLDELDAHLAAYAAKIETHLQKELQHVSGAGAAGGLGFALHTLGASLESGAAFVAKAVNLERRIAQADWIITGEGRTDSQTLHGKLPAYVAKLAKKHAVPAILLSGALDGDIEPLYAHFSSMHAIANGPMTLAEAMGQAEHLLHHKVRNIARLIQARVRK